MWSGSVTERPSRGKWSDVPGEFIPVPASVYGYGRLAGRTGYKKFISGEKISVRKEPVMRILYEPADTDADISIQDDPEKYILTIE